MNETSEYVDPNTIHAPSLKNLKHGDKFLCHGLRYEYEKPHENGHWHWTKALDYPHETTLWNYDAEVDWLDN